LVLGQFLFLVPASSFPGSPAPGPSIVYPAASYHLRCVPFVRLIPLFLESTTQKSPLFSLVAAPIFSRPDAHGKSGNFSTRCAST